jgi:hypothetical protein
MDHVTWKILAAEVGPWLGAVLVGWSLRMLWRTARRLDRPLT